MEMKLSEESTAKIAQVQELIQKAGARASTPEEIIDDILFETAAENLIPFRVKVEAARHDPAKRKKVHKIFTEMTSKPVKRQKAKPADVQNVSAVAGS